MKPCFIDVQTTFDDGKENLAKDLNDIQKNTIPELVKLVSFSFGTFDNEGNVNIGILINHPEFNGKKDKINGIRCLYKFWKIASKCILIAYNLCDFTLPVIRVKTSQLNQETREKYKISPFLIDTRPWGNQIIDLKKARYPHNGLSPTPKSLDWLAEANGIINPTGGSITGDMVSDLYRDGDLDKISLYAKSRILICAELYKKWAGIFVPDIEINMRSLETARSEIFNNLPANIKDRMWEESKTKGE